MVLLQETYIGFYHPILKEREISFIQCNKIAIKTLMVCIMYCKQCPLQNCSSIEFSLLFKEDDSYDKTFSFLQKIKTLLCLEVSSIILI